MHNVLKNPASRLAAATGAVLMLFSTLTPYARAQSYTLSTLHTFAGGDTDGAYPLGGVIMDSEGNLYGTTIAGGSQGTVFKLNTFGNNFTVLHAFASTNSLQWPMAGLIMDGSGTLYGTTASGWPAYNTGGGVFKLDISGNNYAELSHWNNNSWPPDPQPGPRAGLAMDAQGNLYGTSYALHQAGTVFRRELTTGVWATLHNFSGGAGDGAYPCASLIIDTSLNLYGTTSQGGASDAGTVFKLNTSTGIITLLHSFTQANNGLNSDGAHPQANLIMDAQGNLYGTANAGGSYGGGTVFRLDTSGNNFTVLHNFAGGASDGANPSAGLIMDAAGNLYGTTSSGGGSSNFGTVFRLDTVGNNFTVLHPFTGDDGANPSAGLIMDSAGNLYGTTHYGGSSSKGTVFKLAPVLTITADDKIKVLNAANPAFTATYSGFVAGEGPGNLSGTLLCTSSAVAASPVGSYPITCSGQTSTNYDIKYVPGTLKIRYAAAGLACGGEAGHTILPPVNADGSSVWKQGATVSAKFRVCDANGVSIGAAGVVSSFSLKQIIAGTVANVDETVTATNADTAFRWDSSAQQWIFNISTKSLQAGNTYVYAIKLNDGTEIGFQFGLK
jgi:uncharacterized repeat protein (TIGR03803 family)